MQNDIIKIYEAVKKIKRIKPSQKLIIKAKDSLIASPTNRSMTVAEYFQKTFFKNKQPIRAIYH